MECKNVKCVVTIDAEMATWGGCGFADGQGVDAGRDHRLREVPAATSQGDAATCEHCCRVLTSGSSATCL